MVSATRDPQDVFGLTSFVDEINQVDRQFSILPDNLFSMTPTTQTAILFDINSTETTLLPSVDRNGKASTYGSDDSVETRALPLGYFHHSDSIQQADLLGVRQSGTPDGMRTLDLARAEKLQKMRRQADQTLEYMKLKAAFKGQCITPSGDVLADMTQEFATAQPTFDFDLGASDADVQAGLRNLARQVRKGLTNGGFFSGIDLYLSGTLYEKLVTHSSMKEAFKHYSVNGGDPVRGDNLVDSVRLPGGVTLHSLDGSFKLPTGSTEELIEDGKGHVVPRVDGLFRGYYGPSRKLSMTHKPGAVAPLYAWEYNDQRDEYREMSIEMAPLVFPTQIGGLIEVSTST